MKEVIQKKNETPNNELLKILYSTSPSSFPTVIITDHFLYSDSWINSSEEELEQAFKFISSKEMSQLLLFDATR
jgi:hypothetical protein